MLQKKGGSTKTTTAAEIVAALARRGRRVLAVDLDQQGNLTTRCGLERSAEVEAVAADVLTGAASATAAAVPAPTIAGAWIVAGTHDLADLDSRPEVITALRDHLPQVAGFDDVVIDTPPAIGLLTLAALAAADHVVVSLACESESFDQLERLAAVIAARVAPRLRPGAQIGWIVPTRHDGRRRLDREVVELLHERYPGKVASPVREAVAARDAYTAGMAVSIYAPTSAIAADYATALAPLLDGQNGEKT